MREKIKWLVVGFILSTVLVIGCAFLAEYRIIGELYAVLLLAACIALLCVFAFFLGKAEHANTFYICRKCGHTFKPTLTAYFFAAHTIRKRYLRCPECGNKTMCSAVKKKRAASPTSRSDSV